MIKPKYITVIIILVLLALLVLQRECHRCPDCSGQDTATSIVYRVDTVTITKNIYHKAPEPVTIIHHDTIYQDTTLALKDYSSLKIYDRLLMDDSSGRIRLTDSVQYNALKGSVLTAEIHQKHTIETITHTVVQKEAVRAKVFVGVGVGSNMDFRPSLSGQVGLVTGRDRVYLVSYDPFNREAGLGVMWKIRLRELTYFMLNVLFLVAKKKTTYIQISLILEGFV